MAIDAATMQTLLPASFYNNGQLVVSESQAQAVAAGIQARIADMPPAQRDAFLALVHNSTSLAPTGGEPPADISAALDRLELVSGVLANLVGTASSTLEFLARAMIEQAGEQRKSALENRLTSREVARGELLGQAQQMKDAAAQMMSGAIVALVMTVVMSAVSLAAAGVSVGMTAKNLGQMKDPAATMTNLDKVKTEKMNDILKTDFKGVKFDKLPEADQVQVMSRVNASFDKVGFDTAQATMQMLGQKVQQATNIGTIGQTVNQLGQGVGNAASSITQAQAKELEAKGSIFAAQAQYEEGRADASKEVQQALDEMVKSIINFLKELQEAKANQMQALTKV